jgi:hypothetical protein
MLAFELLYRTEQSHCDKNGFAGFGADGDSFDGCRGSNN